MSYIYVPSFLWPFPSPWPIGNFDFGMQVKLGILTDLHLGWWILKRSRSWRVMERPYQPVTDYSLFCCGGTWEMMTRVVQCCESWIINSCTGGRLWAGGLCWQMISVNESCLVVRMQPRFNTTDHIRYSMHSMRSIPSGSIRTLKWMVP